MNEQKNTQDNDLITRLALIVAVLGGLFGGLILKGARRKATWTWGRIKAWFFYSMTVTFIVLAHNLNIPFFIDSLSWIFPKGLGEWVYFNVPRGMQFTVLVVIPFLGWLGAIGAAVGLRVRKYQVGLDHLGLRTSSDLKPVIIDSFRIGEHQKKLLVRAIGIDISDFKNRKGALESAFNAIVEDIRVLENDRQFIEILLAEKSLPTLVGYDEMVTKHLVTPYTFLVGQSLGEFIVGNLLELHHMIVAGSTGGGKSFFFKQALMGIAESSKHIQFYLIDLKRGVEVKIFERLDNVRIAKEAHEAIAILTAVVDEMDKRFKFLEEKGLTEIVPDRDKMDRIIVGIDEASVLFTIEKSSRSSKAAAQSARDLTDRIAKLGRAAAIHLILATQKVVKETIDTRVQTNINARMVFRVNTVASSMTVLGNKMAAELPEIKGRGIWSVGSKDIVVQVPRLSPEEANDRVDDLLEKFNGTGKCQFGPMLLDLDEVQPKKNIFETSSNTKVQVVNDEVNAS